MNRLYFFSFLFLNVAICDAQYCTSAGPTSTVDSNVESVLLTGDSGGLSHTGCPGVTGTQDLTAQVVSLSSGSTYSIDIQFGTCGGNYAGVGEAWIDYNMNQLFDPSESIGTWVGTPPVTLSTFTFTVPATIVAGTTRIRIMQSEAASLPLSPCSSFSWGSVMDFTVVLTGGIDCSGYVGNTISDPIVVSTTPYTNTHDNSFCYTNDNNTYVSPDVYYLILPTGQPTSLDVSLCGSSFDTFLTVIDVDSNVISYNDDGNCGSQSELNFTTNGTDSVYVIVEGWGSQSGPYVINIQEPSVGIETRNEKDILVYPNPASSSFSIRNANSERVEIFTINGKKVREIQNYKGTEIDVSMLESGIYLIHILDKRVKLIVK